MWAEFVWFRTDQVRNSCEDDNYLSGSIQHGQFLGPADNTSASWSTKTAKRLLLYRLKSLTIHCEHETQLL